MPMTWNAEADQKLFAAVLKTTDIKLDYAALAAIMGPECTPKAVTHRICSIRARVKPVADGTDSVAASYCGDSPTDPSAPTAPKRGRPAKPKTGDTAKPKKTAGKGKGKGKAVPSEEKVLSAAGSVEHLPDDFNEVEKGPVAKKLKMDPYDDEAF